jgi:hypothetical protein
LRWRRADLGFCGIALEKSRFRVIVGLRWSRADFVGSEMGSCTARGGGGGLAASSARALRLLAQRSWLLEKSVVAKQQVEKHAQVLCAERSAEEPQICTRWELERRTCEPRGERGGGAVCRTTWLTGSVETEKRGEQYGTALWDRFASLLKVSPRDVCSSSPDLMNDPRLVEPSRLLMVPWQYSTTMSGVCIQQRREKTLVSAQGMLLPGMEDDDDDDDAVPLEASSVKRKRKKKMNKHKQRKLRRRDRHRN